MHLFVKFFDYLFGLGCILGLLIAAFHVLPSPIEYGVLILLNLIGLIPICASAYKALRERQATVDLLASIALIFSLLAGELTSALFIQLMLVFARIFSRYTQDNVHESLKFLLKLRPNKARVMKNQEIVEVDIAEIKLGEVVVVKLGERIAVDGIVIEGAGSVDQSSFTGESLPVEKHVGDEVLTSTLLTSGELKIKTMKLGEDTSFAWILKLVNEAQDNKSKISGLGQKFASVYVLAILSLSFIIWALTGNLSLVVSILLVVCADDIAIAIPLAFTAAISNAARSGILIKGGIYLEAVGKLKVLLFDKTGTLTTGKLQVRQFINLSDDLYSISEALILAGSLADLSTHPISKTIHAYMHSQHLSAQVVKEFREDPGLGIAGKISGKEVKLGKLEFLELKIEVPAKVRELQQEGNNLTFLSVNGQLCSLFAIADQIKPEAKSALAELKLLGLEKLVMLTGDNEMVAHSVASMLGIETYRANLLPEDKLNFIKQTVAHEHYVGMVGDGVNDAPALNLATVGISMGAVGSDVAIESADIVLMRDDLTQIPYVIKLARKVNGVAIQNFGLWIILNLIGLVLVFSGALNPAQAAAYNFVTDIFTILNAMRLIRGPKQTA
jgi:Cd2+/Zn2+-exporting ATPase